MTTRSTRMAAAAAAVVAMASLAGCADGGTSEDGGDLTGKVYLLMPKSDTIRYERWDVPNLTEAIHKYAPDMEVIALNAQNSATTQQAQMETALSNGAKGIILGAASADQTGGLLAKAAAEDVPVVNYASDAHGGPISAYVSVPFEQIGEFHGKYFSENLPPSADGGPVKVALMYGDPAFAFYTEQVKGIDKYLQPLVDQGKVEIVCDSDALLFAPPEAQKNMEQCLTQTNNGVDAVFIMNDDIGSAVQAALMSENLAGKVRLFGGYDASLEGIQRVIAGSQPVDLAPPYKAMADAAAQILIAEIKGEEPPADLLNGEFDNQFQGQTVPAAYIPNDEITIDTVQEVVVDGGLYTKEQLCTGVATGSAFCS